MSIHTFHGGRVPQSGGRLISSTLGQPKIFFPHAQVGYGIGGILKPLARTVFSAVKVKLKKFLVI